jgi:hypothetical protein
MAITAENPPICDAVVEESRRLREESLRIREGLGQVIHLLLAERIASRRAIRPRCDALQPFPLRSTLPADEDKLWSHRQALKRGL